MNQVPDPDAWMDQLRSVQAVGQSEEFRKALLVRTTRLVRRRLWIRRAVLASTLAACYVAGLFTMRWVAPPAAEVVVQVASAGSDEKKADVPKAETLQPPAEATAKILEQWGPLVDVGKRAGVYRRAGDRYYVDHNDLQGALRCYRRALDAGSQDDLQIAANDNWLLIALKEARTKEKRNATN
jgi:hypothetical protein